MWIRRLFRRTNDVPAAPAVQRAAWLSANTFHHSRFSDLHALVERKQKLGVSISVCLPTLNEAATIGKEIAVLKGELMTRYPLVDELAVIDSGSTDDTCEIARAFGADAYVAAEILPETGNLRGKGENLWKAVYQMRGDIIVYVDADISNFHARFVYGLLGPLLTRPEVKYVKAFYDRPLGLSPGVRVSGGGRVTELLVRPLFSMFYPDLSAIIQPLSGEYAVRREVLERIPFPTGYGVETAHLLDVYRRWGLAAFAQTDLDRRIHRNQSTQQLGRMSFAILHTFLQRARAHGMLKGLTSLSPLLQQFQARDAVYEQVEWRYEDGRERPPMLEVPAYRARYPADRREG